MVGWERCLTVQATQGCNRGLWCRGEMGYGAGIRL